MNENILTINNKISYLKASKDPLSADVGIIQGDERTWFFDVGSNEEAYQLIMNESKKIGIVISHFHPDHMGNLAEILSTDRNPSLYVGDNTFKYCKQGEIVTTDIFIEDGCKLHIFPLPSSHAKGSLGLEIDEKYAFLGDGTYATKKGGKVVYNVQHLKEEIRVLSSLKATYFILSHREPIIQEKDQVLKQLNRIYDMRKKSEAYIYLT